MTFLYFTLFLKIIKENKINKKKIIKKHIKTKNGKTPDSGLIFCEQIALLRNQINVYKKIGNKKQN